MYYFNKDKMYVSGAYCSAIYDLPNKIVYSINHAGKIILDKVQQGNNDFSKEDNEYLNSLLEMNLLSLQKQEHTLFNKKQCAIKYVWLELTSACNLRCVHCYGEFGTCPEFNKDIMKTEDWKKVLDFISQEQNVGIQFIGGEPLAFAGFTELLDYAKTLNIKRIDIFTNATLLTNNLIEKIKRKWCFC